jgi:aminoglycoside 3-N-acetyltransferase
MARKPLVTTADIAAGLRRLGLRRGDKVVVHSSLSSFGFVDGGAYAVLDALMEVVGQTGTLVFPTFNHGRYMPFDRNASPSFNGRLTETFRHLPGVIRGNHPTHAYAVWGRDVSRYTRDNHRAITWGDTSPLGRLIADGGWVLLLGVGHVSSTAQHHAEVAHRVKCLGLDTLPSYILDDEGEKTATVGPSWRDGQCLYTHQIHEARTRRLGAVRDTYIGGAHIQLFRGSQTLKAIGQLLRGETGVDYCPTCERRPRVPGPDWFTRPRRPSHPSKWDARPDKEKR